MHDPKQSVVVGKQMDPPIVVSDSFKPNWSLVEPNSDTEFTWAPASTICTALYPIFISPEDEDSEDDPDEGGWLDDSSPSAQSEDDKSAKDSEWHGCTLIHKRKSLNSESSQQRKSESF